MNFTSTITATGYFSAEGSVCGLNIEHIVVANDTEDAIVDKIRDRTDTIGWICILVYVYSIIKR